MRSHLLLLIALTTFCLSCQQKESSIDRQNRLFKRDAPHVLGEIRAMLEKDQSIRQLQKYGTADTNHINSLITAYARKGLDLEQLLLTNDTLLVTAKFRDSVKQLTKQQDEQHTRRMIALINLYGYPESDRINSTTHISPFLLLHHPSSLYKDTLLHLLSSELQVHRIDTVSYEMIKWTLNGREGLPEIKGMKVTKNSDGTTSITL